MTRGHAASVGDESIVNGYIYVCLAIHKDKPNEWKPKHRLVMEKHLGRRLTDREYVRFKDGDRQNFDIDNLILSTKKQTNKRESLERRLAEIQDQLGSTKWEEPPNKFNALVAVLPGHKCFYCGETAVTTDTLIPEALITDVPKRNKPNVPKVLSCQHCKSILAHQVITDIVARLKYVADRKPVSRMAKHARDLADWLASIPAPEGAHVEADG